MSYAIDRLRRLMYGADLGQVGIDIAVLGPHLVAALLVTTLGTRRLRVWTGARLKPELSL